MAKPGKNDPAALSALPAGASMTAPRSEGPRPSRKAKGLAVTRRVTKDAMTAQEGFDQVEWTRRPAKISGADGEVVFKMDDAEVPAEWSQLATDVAVSKYFRKAGVPTKSGAEESVRQLVRRVAHTLRDAGESFGGYFATPADAESFEAELTYMLVHQIGAFIQWKAREEKKVSALIAAGYSSDFNGDAYRTVSGQNANNSVRVTDKFIEAVQKDGVWETVTRTTGEVVEKLAARDLWREMAQAAWQCADPGLQFDDTINKWHTCKQTDRIYASNPCSEFVFLDDTACNLASLNLLKFLDEKTGEFDVEGYKHACRIFFLAQEIAVDLASYPTKRIAERSHQFRPLGLGYANLGTLLMVEGLPYDSHAGRAYAAAVTAVMTGEAYALSAEMAASKGPFQGYAHNRESMLEVMRMHRDSVQNIDRDAAPSELLAAAHEVWNRAVSIGEQHGYRNAQATVLAPTGTIGLLMDCDTTGVEPDFALSKFKKLAGGGSFKIINQSVPRALKKLGYGPAEVQAIVDYVRGAASLKSVPEFAPAELETRGLLAAEVAKVEKSLESVFDLRAAFAPHILGAACLQRLGLDGNAKGKAVLAKLGYTEAQIDQATLVV